MPISKHPQNSYKFFLWEKTQNSNSIIYTIVNRTDPASKRLAPRQPRLLPCRRKTHFRGHVSPPRRLAQSPTLKLCANLLLSPPYKYGTVPKPSIKATSAKAATPSSLRMKTHFRGARHLPKLPIAKPNLQDTCRHHDDLHKVPHQPISPRASALFPAEDSTYLITKLDSVLAGPF
ncbi:Plant protein of unknown function D [Prunus dulcis]|uniref:Uncharacterized protein n=1 Tax=Prunus dulcis TaxID=3755 RepID=A0A4Y1RXB2_PRUDU|nr:Plant protein of unknown function D [Prunus dulcis]